MSSPSEKNPDSFDVFISHATDDRALAEQIDKALEQAGYRCFLATDDLSRVVGTKQWSEAIESILTTTPVLVVLITAPALASKWVTFEWRAFHEEVLGGRRSGLIVPVLWERRELRDVPIALRHWQLIDIAQQGETRGLEELVRLIDGFRTAARDSDVELNRELRWTSHPPAALPIETAARPQKPSASLAAWLSMAGVALLAVGLLLYFGTATKEQPQPSAKGGAGLTAKSAKKVAAPEDNRTTPRAGWEPIEAYAEPTPANRNMLNRLESWDEAKRAFERSCQSGCSARQRAGLHFAAAEASRLSGKLDEAAEAFDQAHAADRSWAMPLVGLATVNTSRNPRLAIQHAKEAYEKDPGLWIALAVKAAAFVQQKKYVEAIQELLEARGRAPSKCIPLLDGTLALTYHSEGLRDAKAAKLAKAACTPEQRIAAACAVLAEQALEKGDADAAIDYVELSDRDDFVPLLLALGDAHQMKKESKLAWAAWRRAIALKDRAELQGTAPKRLKAIETAVATNQLPPPRPAERTTVRIPPVTSGRTGPGGGMPAPHPGFSSTPGLDSRL